MKKIVFLYFLLTYHYCLSQTHEQFKDCEKIESNWGKLLKAKISCLFDFDKMELCSLSAETLKDLIQTQGYEEIKANFKSYSISIFVTIKWKEYGVTFDPMYEGMFVMPYNQKIPFIKEKYETREIQFTNSKGNPVKAFDFLYKNKAVYFNGNGYNSEIVVSHKTKKAMIGMRFIKGFNWIIDTAHKKVYVKKNSVSLD